MKKLETILLVDDDYITQFINRSLIQKLDICAHIELVTNGLEALQFLKDNKVDLIFLDLSMPVMDGFEFLKNYGTEFVSGVECAKIVILTTSANRNDLKKIKELDYVSDYLNKPLTKEKVYSVLKDF